MLNDAGEFERSSSRVRVVTELFERGIIIVLTIPLQVVCGTPGRIMDLIRRKVLSPAAIRTVVLDEVCSPSMSYFGCFV